uniref:(northern house mosquito) hypothetical protein n=1 Tax=Culex pipiens TaxID=7175 RepID=A0A8D8KQC1_CULPI
MSLSEIDGNYNPLQPDSEGSYEEVEHLLEEEKEEEDDTGAIDYNPFSDDDEQEDLAEEDPQPVAECSKSKRPRCEKLFSFNAVFCQKLFRNQLRPKENSSTRVVGDSIEDVIECLWDTGKDLIKRQVVFQDNVPKWAVDEKPKFDNVGKFFLLQDMNARKTYGIENLTARLLQRWRDQSIKIFVFAYSLDVENKNQFNDVLKHLITPSKPDRAGANSMRDESALANELQEGHPHLEGHFSSWLLWASVIHAAPAHEQEGMKKAPNPPATISKYFRWVGVSEAARLEGVHRGMVVANTINSRNLRQIRELKMEFSTAMVVLQGAFKRLEVMEAEAEASSGIVSAMETVMQPEESELSQQLAAEVTNCFDDQHA